MKKSKKWFYMSFVNESAPEGERWVGGSMVLATDLQDAIVEAWKFGVNGGGQVAGVALPEGMQPAAMDAYRLITDADEARNLEFIRIENA